MEPRMKKLMIAALAATAVGAALADDPTLDTLAHTPSLKSRGQVLAELARAKADGSIKAWANVPQLNKAQDIRSVKTRAEVKADVLAARDAGALNAGVGEDSGALALSQPAGRGIAPTLLAGKR
jgi:hypothetical protein